jgi:hypothetical protein
MKTKNDKKLKTHKILGLAKKEVKKKKEKMILKKKKEILKIYQIVAKDSMSNLI